LVDYIWIFFYISQYFWQMSDCIFMISVNFIKKKISKTTIIIYGPSSLYIRSELSKHTGRPVLAYGPTSPRLRADLSLSELSAGRVVWYPFNAYCLLSINKKSLKIPKGQSESVYGRRTDNTMAKRKSTKGQTTIYKAYI
jgi:hypothetical protein